jgi:DNA-binding LacI/PurR family transcriptional regulator
VGLGAAAGRAVLAAASGQDGGAPTPATLPVSLVERATTAPPARR